MTVVLNNDTKNTVPLTLEAKPNLTWNEATMSWDEADGTWDNPGTPLSTDSKNTVSLTNETKA